MYNNCTTNLQMYNFCTYCTNLVHSQYYLNTYYSTYLNVYYTMYCITYIITYIITQLTTRSAKVQEPVSYVH